MFAIKDIYTGFRNSVFYTVVGTLFNLALTLPCGYGLSKKSLPGKSALMIFLLIPMYFSGGLIPTYFLVNALHLPDTWLVLIVMSAVNITNVIICRTFFQGIPHELEEAANIDGCSLNRMFFSVILPMSKALIMVMILFYAVEHWNYYMIALVYQKDAQKAPLQLVLRQLLVLTQILEGESDPNFLANAQAIKSLIKYCTIIVSSLPLLIVYPFMQKYFDKGVTLGALKG